MKYFLLLVQEKGDNMPAPVSEGVACAATAAAPPLPPPLVWLHEKFDYLSRYIASIIPLCYPSYSPIWTPPFGTTDGNLTCNTCFNALLLRKATTKSCIQKEQLSITAAFVGIEALVK